MRQMECVELETFRSLLLAQREKSCHVVVEACGQQHREICQQILLTKQFHLIVNLSPKGLLPSLKQCEEKKLPEFFIFENQAPGEQNAATTATLPRRTNQFQLQARFSSFRIVSVIRISQRRRWCGEESFIFSVQHRKCLARGISCISSNDDDDDELVFVSAVSFSI